MNVVVLNAGSGSMRCSLFRLDATTPTAAEIVEPAWEARLDSTAPGQPAGELAIEVRCDGKPAGGFRLDAALAPAGRVQHLLRGLWSRAGSPWSSPDAIDAVGHRVVHGGPRMDRAVRVDRDVERVIEHWSPQAPLHNPVALAGIRAAREVYGDRAVHVAVFDTAFHHRLPDAAATYPGPWAWREGGIRRYGFHGTNYRWLVDRAAHLLRRVGDPELRLVLCHLGGGCSLCATRGGESLDTTMGFTPLDGIAMSTRPGALDPGILLHFLRVGRSRAELETEFSRESGLKGLSGVSGDTRVLTPLAASGHARARLALEVFVHRLRAGIGQMLPALGGRPDALVFSDAIAEDEPPLRAGACEPFAFLGLRLDREKNLRAEPDMDLATEDSPVRALLIKSREGWQIAREVRALLADLR